MTKKLNFGEIWLADLKPRNGTELGKVRPVLIIQSQDLLRVNHSSTVVIPMTTQLIEGMSYLRIRVKAQGNLKRDSDLLIDQIRAIDNKRLTDGPLTRCDSEFMKLVHLALLDVIDFRLEDANTELLFLHEPMKEFYK
jgi:mRNA interferase MazF